ncbi:MAG: hypothetical protein NVS9B4_03570 [Candidatus Acidiferrum sp.]
MPARKIIFLILAILLPGGFVILLMRSVLKGITWRHNDKLNRIRIYGSLLDGWKVVSLVLH